MKLSRLTVYLAVVVAIALALVMYAPLPTAIAFSSLALLPLVPVAALRFLAGIFLLVATVALVSDLTPVLNGMGPLHLTSLAEHWAQMSPASFSAAHQSVLKAAGPWLWEGPLTGIISWPTSLLFGVLAALCGYAGRRRHEINIYLN